MKNLAPVYEVHYENTDPEEKVENVDPEKAVEKKAVENIQCPPRSCRTALSLRTARW